MVELAALWKPILLSAVVVHFASAIIWMVSPLHKHDYKKTGDKEKPLLDFIRAQGLAPGAYVLPMVERGQNCKDPANIEKMKTPPVLMTIAPSAFNMGRSMGLWIFNLAVIGLFVAYISSHALAPGAPYLKVFQIVGATSFLAYAGNSLTMSIWMGQPWTQVPGRVVDGLIYALLTAGTFGWLWPAAH